MSRLPRFTRLGLAARLSMDAYASDPASARNAMAASCLRLHVRPRTVVYAIIDLVEERKFRKRRAALRQGLRTLLLAALAAMPIGGCLSWEDSGWDARQGAINSYYTSGRPYVVPGSRYWTGSSHCCASGGGRR